MCHLNMGKVQGKYRCRVNRGKWQCKNIFVSYIAYLPPVIVIEHFYFLYYYIFEICFLKHDFSWKAFSKECK